MSKQARVISLANQKGGVGKTTTTTFVSMELASQGYKVLNVDLDSQTNLTDKLLQTKYPNQQSINVDVSLMNCVDQDLDLKDAIVNIEPNLDLIPSTFDIFNYEYYLFENYSDYSEQSRDLKSRIDQLRPYYDFIFVDTPPSISAPSTNAFMACDEIVMIMQTRKESLDGVQNFIHYLENTLIGSFDANIDVLGVLPVLNNANDRYSHMIVNAAREKFGKYVFNNVVPNLARVERMTLTGITNNKKNHWDLDTYSKYKSVTNELIKRLKEE